MDNHKKEMTVKKLSVSFKYTTLRNKTLSAHDKITKLIKEEIKRENNHRLMQGKNEKVKKSHIKVETNKEETQKSSSSLPISKEKTSTAAPVRLRSPELQRIFDSIQTAQDKSKSFSELYSNEITTALSYLQSYSQINDKAELKWLENSTSIAQTLANWRHFYKLLDQRKRQIRKVQRESKSQGEGQGQDQGQGQGEGEGEGCGNQEDGDESSKTEKVPPKELNVPKTRGTSNWRSTWRGRGRDRGKRKGFK